METIESTKEERAASAYSVDVFGACMHDVVRFADGSCPKCNLIKEREMGGNLEVHITDAGLHAMAKGIRLSEIRGATDKLEALCTAKIDAAEDFANAVKLAALQGGVDASVLSTYITAKVNDTLKKKQNQAEQLALLFDEL